MSKAQTEAREARKERIRHDLARKAERAFVNAGYLQGQGTEDVDQFMNVVAHFIADTLHLAAEHGLLMNSDDEFFNIVLNPAIRFYRADGGTMESRTLDREDEES